MNPVKLIIASKKKLIVKSIEKMLTKDPNVQIIATAFDKDYLTKLLQLATADALIIDQQMLDELYLWKNMHPKMLKRSLKVLLITSKKHKNNNGTLPGFFPNKVTYWEKGMDELLMSFQYALKNQESFNKEQIYIINSPLSKIGLN